MNLRDATGVFRKIGFKLSRAFARLIPGGRIRAFGVSRGQIGSVLVINLDRQPDRWRRTLHELDRFRTDDDRSLKSITHRLPATDARDGRAVAATADVDPQYRVGHQLHVQPDPKLAATFGTDEPVRMTRQEVAVARSHIEAWKRIAHGPDDYVLVLEDDVWFRPGAAKAIDRGWRAALDHCSATVGPRLVYFSYSDADGTAEKIPVGEALVQPVRGFWFLSGYVLSREGAAALLRAMPVVGPVDMWMNYRLEELGALALSSPAILQRQDAGSDNAYSILPYLARAGTIDASSAVLPPGNRVTSPVLAWTGRGEHESLPMALSMLGLRVRVFDGDEAPLDEGDLSVIFATFDAIVDAPVADEALAAASAKTHLLVEGAVPKAIEADELLRARTTLLTADDPAWSPLCAALGLLEPVQPYPRGAARYDRLFRDLRDAGAASSSIGPIPRDIQLFDETPWTVPVGAWRPRPVNNSALPALGRRLEHASMEIPSACFVSLSETFPGNLAVFATSAVAHEQSGVRLKLDRAGVNDRPYRSGAFASVAAFKYGRFEAEIKAAAGSGLVTGFFLHRASPRQEIDVEIFGADPTQMLVNVYFNPGDDGAALAYGYRGSPIRIPLGFDATRDFHRYAIDWRPGEIAWLVDDIVVHVRRSWDPTPIPHLDMRLHGNLWAPRSIELAGVMDEAALPATTTFRNLSVYAASI